MWKLLALLFGVALGDLENSARIIFGKVPNTLGGVQDGTCEVENRLYEEHFENFTLWAHEMWDASAKGTTGILRGNTFQMGDWHECVTIKGPFRTQYCLATIIAESPQPQPPRDTLSLYYSPYETVLSKIHKIDEISLQTRHEVQMGLCIPASCRPLDLEDSLNQYLSRFDEAEVKYTAKVSEKFCQTEGDGEGLDTLDIAFCCLTLVILLLVVSSTVCDFFRCPREEFPTVVGRIFIAFSARGNFLDLPKCEDSNSALRILYGMKTLCIFMIIMDHRFGTFLSGPIVNFDYIEEQYRSRFAAFLFHGDLFVDSFFVLSGLLVAYSLLVQFDKRMVNPLSIIFLRYVRLTPLYAYVVFYWATMLNHIGSGPLWKLIVGQESGDCRKNWWTNVLYISNYVNDNEMCMLHSWYLPCDFHYFMIGIFLTLVISRRKRLGLGILMLLLLLSIIVPFLITIVYRRPAIVQFYPGTLRAPKAHPDMQLTYTKTHARAVSYVIGMFAGYIYYKLRDTTKRLSKITSHALTLASFLTLFVSLATGSVFYDRYHEYNAIEAAAYAALHRVAWGVGTSGMLFSASHGHAGFIKSLLSWSSWIPLAKLVYGAYLIHMSFQFRSVAMSAAPKYFTYFDLMSLSLSDVVLAFGTALLLHLGIEAPVRKIFKELLGPARSHTTKTFNRQSMQSDDSKL